MYLLLSNVDSDLLEVLENLDVNQNLSIHKFKQLSRSSRNSLPPGYMGMMILEPPLYEVALQVSEVVFTVVINLVSNAIYKHFEERGLRKPIKINGRSLLEQELKNEESITKILKEKLNEQRSVNKNLQDELDQLDD